LIIVNADCAFMHAAPQSRLSRRHGGHRPQSARGLRLAAGMTTAARALCRIARPGAWR
jgi:hypothetical protein